MTILLQNYFNLENTKPVTKIMLLPSLELTILIIYFSLANLKTALKTLQVENFKKHLMTKEILLTTRQPKTLKNYFSRSEI